jgi:hypothetical protein
LAGTPSAARSVELGGGAIVFAIAAVGGLAVIGWIVAVVRRGLSASSMPVKG